MYEEYVTNLPSSQFMSNSSKASDASLCTAAKINPSSVFLNFLPLIFFVGNYDIAHNFM